MTLDAPRQPTGSLTHHHSQSGRTDGHRGAISLAPMASKNRSYPRWLSKFQTECFGLLFAHVRVAGAANFAPHEQHTENQIAIGLAV